MRQHQREHLQRALGARRNLVLADVVDPVTSLDDREKPAAVRARARFHENLRRVEMEVVERDHDRRETLRRLGVDVGTRFDQHAQSGDGTMSGRKHHRRQTGRRNFHEVANGGLALRQIVDRSSRIDVGARGDQCGRDVAAIVRGRVHQRRLALPALDDVDVRAVIDEQSDGLHTARSRREHQRCFALRQREIHVGAGVEERAEQTRVCAKRGLVHRPYAVAIREIRIGFRAEQRSHAADVAEMGGIDQRRRAVRGARVRVGACGKQRADFFRIGVLCCAEQFPVEIGIRRGTERHSDKDRREGTNFGRRLHGPPSSQSKHERRFA